MSTWNEVNTFEKHIRESLAPGCRIEIAERVVPIPGSEKPDWQVDIETFAGTLAGLRPEVRFFSAKQVLDHIFRDDADIVVWEDPARDVTGRMRIFVGRLSERQMAMRGVP